MTNMFAGGSENVSKFKGNPCQLLAPSRRKTVVVNAVGGLQKHSAKSISISYSTRLRTKHNLIHFSNSCKFTRGGHKIVDIIENMVNVV